MWANWSTPTLVSSAWPSTRTRGSPSTPPLPSRSTLARGGMRLALFMEPWILASTHNFSGERSISTVKTFQNLMWSWSNVRTSHKRIQKLNWSWGLLLRLNCFIFVKHSYLVPGPPSYLCHRWWCLPEHGQPRWTLTLNNSDEDLFTMKKEKIKTILKYFRKEPVNSCHWRVRSWKNWEHQKGWMPITLLISHPPIVKYH